MYLYEQVLLTFVSKSTEKRPKPERRKEIKKKNKIKQKIKLPNVIRIVCHPRKNVFVIRLLHYRIPSLNKTQKKTQTQISKVGLDTYAWTKTFCILTCWQSFGTLSEHLWWNLHPQVRQQKPWKKFVKLRKFVKLNENFLEEIKLTWNNNLLQGSQKASEKNVFRTKLCEIDVVTGKKFCTSTFILSPSTFEMSISHEMGVWKKPQIIDFTKLL